MTLKPDDSVCVYGAIAMDRFLDAMRQEIDGVRLGDDIECIHRMRVASRRMRSALDLFKACLPAKPFPSWVSQVRKVTGALGAARDTDVQIEHLAAFSKQNAGPRDRPGLNRLNLRLRQKRQRVQGKVLKSLEQLEQDHLLDDLHKRLSKTLEKQSQAYLYTPAIYQLGYESISTQLDDLLTYEPYVSHPEQEEELHALRIAAKKLRYTLEIFAPLYPGELKDPLQACRKIQDTLGEMHDCDVWIQILAEFLDDERRRTQEFFGNLNGYFRLVPGVECFLNDRRAARDTSYQDFYTFWQAQTEQGTWSNLRGQIQIPFFRGEPQAGGSAISSQPESGDLPA
jgi:CHAD domain-containing protein